MLASTVKTTRLAVHELCKSPKPYFPNSKTQNHRTLDLTDNTSNPNVETPKAVPQIRRT